MTILAHQIGDAQAQTLYLAVDDQMSQVAMQYDVNSTALSQNSIFYYNSDHMMISDYPSTSCHDGRICDLC